MIGTILGIVGMVLLIPIFISIIQMIIDDYRTRQHMKKEEAIKRQEETWEKFR